MEKQEPGYRAYKLMLKALPSVGLLVLYFLGVSLFGVSLVVPYAFLWLMWTLGCIKDGLDKQKEEMEKIAAR